MIFLRWTEADQRLVLSDSCKEILGFSSEEVQADPALWRTIIDEPSAVALLEATKVLVEGREARARAVLHARSRDGHQIWLTCHLVALGGGSTPVTGWEGVAVDATELVTARRQAEEAREVFRVLFEQSPMPVVVYDPLTLVIERANSRAEGLYGVRSGELVGSFVSEWVSPDEWPRTQEHIARAVDHPGVSFFQRTVHRKADGTLIPVQVAGVNVEVDGKKRRLITLRDLTDIEEANERVKNMYRALEATPTPMVLFDATWTVTMGNQAFYTLTRLLPEGVVGRDFQALLDPASGLALTRYAPDFARGKPYEGEGGVRTKSGEMVRGTLTVTPVAEGRDAPARYFANFRPMAPDAPLPPQTAGEVALFFDLLAHDVTNYLTAVRGYLELVLATGGLPAPSQRMAEVARTQTNNALDLVRDTRKVASLQRDPVQALAEGDLVKILDEAVLRIEPLLQTRRFKVRKEYRITKAPVRSPDLIREVFVNLLHNALKFDPHADVLIDLTVEKTSSEGRPSFTVRVADRGIGVSDDDRARLFERGFRPSSAAARHADTIAPPGSGIGLSLCKFIVERAGGSIRAESRIPGDHRQGTAFVVTLPAA